MTAYGVVVLFGLGLVLGFLLGLVYLYVTTLRAG